ncbi:alpha/beta hydrolase [Paenibacillus nanensis]|uniref:Alpha/beta hydrolase n=1 Tax=Paenibacillus nanensis TaxID=393251 RepID=A0A3A1VHX8_9BACL|nr:alpha/beta hydrolase [Paenibacillus nanensis]RIX60539.1 alpha/beta hydrolase [Paenibacillus nanensis]
MIAIVVILLLAALTLTGFYFYRVAIARSDKDFLNGNPDLAVTDASDPSKERLEAWWAKQTFQEWSMTSEDGLSLRAYYLPADTPSCATVILAHGYSGQAQSMGSLAQMYNEILGFNVLLPDARGHGRSEGGFIGFGWPERRDYVGWIQQILHKNGGNSEIVLHGISMGGATVMMTSGEELPSQVKAIIEDCGYTSAKEQLAYQLRRMYKLPAFPLLHATSLITKLRAGYSFGEASALKQVKKSKTPMLFIHGDADVFVPFRMVKPLYESAQVQKELLIVPGAGHGLARQTNPRLYDETVIRFLSQYMSERPERAIVDQAGAGDSL